MDRESQSNPPELLLVDKPKDITSFGVVAKVRKKFDIKKVGHAGTLDPLATGLLLLGIGKGTKKLANLVGLDKEYVAEILVGERRSTGDMEGEVLESVGAVDDITESRVREVLDGMTGKLRLPVSAYSAIKRDGVPMYKRARAAEKKGKQVAADELPVRDMIVHEAELVEIETTIPEYKDGERVVIKVRFLVGSGTYIRSLAEEFGKRLGYPATLYNLRRTKVGEFDVCDAVVL